MSPRGIFTHVEIILRILDCLGQVLYLGRAPRTKETLPDFLKWRRVTRPPTCIPRVDGKSTDPWEMGRHKFLKDFRSHSMFPRMGTVGGPGGRLFVFWKRWKSVWRDVPA